jgi:putative flavoprotein involved in K+ transport
LFIGNAMPQAAVVIVGAGASGLSAAGALQRRGIDAIILEQDRDIGGVWARRYDRLRLHTVRGLSGLAHHPIPSRYPAYLSREEYAAYLADYAGRFGLRIETGCEVRTIKPDGGTSPGWIAVTPRGDWHARAIVVATGQYRVPLLPQWPGRENFCGSLVHSAHYTTGSAYGGKRVLVVGLGNSGAEIATDLVEHGAAHVAVSVRTPPPIVARDPFGIPVQRVAHLLSVLPPALADGFARLASRLVLGDLTRYGLKRAAWMPYSAQRVPVIDVGFVSVLKRGHVRIRSALARLTPEGAVFDDGSREAFDAVIAASGFGTGLENLIEANDVLTASHEPIAASGEPTARPGLFFLGYGHSLRGHLFEANRASRKLAENIAEYLAVKT